MATIFEKVCPVCGKTFTTTRNRAQMCSIECRTERNRTLNRQKVDAVCVVCGKDFQKSKNSSRNTCSQKCFKIYTPKRISEGMTKEPARKKEKKCNIVKIEKEARKNGLHYADIQKQKTLAMVGGVKL